LSQKLKVPVTCKVRRFESVEKTVNYAKMLVAAGCKMLTVHGRTREQKGPLTGLADWSYVKAVREAVNIPVISNGNIQCMEDVDRCLEETGAVAVMTAEGNLYNPALFLRQNPPCWEPALEYLSLVDQYPCPMSYMRGHLFKLFHHVLSIPSNNNLRIQLGAANTTEEFRRITKVIKDMYEPFHEGLSVWSDTTEYDSENLVLPPWLCQPYVRVCPEKHLKKVEENSNKQEVKRRFKDSEGNQISRKRMKKLRRISRRPPKPDCVQTEKNLIKCAKCVNPLGSKCGFLLCKKCCKNKCFLENLDCLGHRILVKTRREMARFYASKKNNTELIDVS
jgi:tRNA-dihydrouridine synthase 1